MYIYTYISIWYVCDVRKKITESEMKRLKDQFEAHMRRYAKKEEDKMTLAMRKTDGNRINK